jgi:hypothetical protein
MVWRTEIAVNCVTVFGLDLGSVRLPTISTFSVCYLILEVNFVQLCNIPFRHKAVLPHYFDIDICYGKTVADQNYVHEGKSRLNSENLCYHPLQNVSFHPVYKNATIKIHKNIIFICFI